MNSLIMVRCEECGAEFRAEFRELAEASLESHREVHIKEQEPSVEQAIRILLRDQGIADSQAIREQLAVFLDALSIYADRRARYGDGWKRYGWLDSLFHMRNKMLRTEAEFYHSPPDDAQQAVARLDNPRDLLNYTAFFIRNVESNNERGTDSD